MTVLAGRTGSSCVLAAPPDLSHLDLHIAFMSMLPSPPTVCTSPAVPPVSGLIVGVFLRIAVVSVASLRHFAATAMLEAGADLYTVSRMLGHASITTTANV